MVSAPLLTAFIDARTDFASTSSEMRLRLAALRAFCKTLNGDVSRLRSCLTSNHLDYINNFMHPQAIIVDSTFAEDDYFLQAARDQIRATRSALIELPDKPETRLAWISNLDAMALSGKYFSFLS